MSDAKSELEAANAIVAALTGLSEESRRRVMQIVSIYLPKSTGSLGIYTGKGVNPRKVIAHLESVGEARFSDIGEATGIHSATLTNVLYRLVGKGILIRPSLGLYRLASSPTSPVDNPAAPPGETP